MPTKSLFLGFLILISNCGGPVSKEKEAIEESSDHVRLSAKVSTYETLQNLDSNKFLLADTCDSLLFTGLYSAAKGPAHWNGLIEAARGVSPKGRIQWFRNPSKNCGVGGKLSASTISRDMLLGLLWHIAVFKRIDLAEELMKDLRAHKYQLEGEGTLGELLVNPPLMSTLALIIRDLGGPSYKTELSLPYYQTAGTGFVSHLTVWHILLRARLLGGVTENELSVLRELSEREPQNPLYQLAYHRYLDGNLDSGVNLLLDSSQWPESSLPTSSNHCSEWPIQRDQGPDWLPCPEENKTYTGAELVVLFKLLVGE